MRATANDVLEFVKENDVKFIRLAFCDLFGRQKNISIMPAELTRAFEHGIPFDSKPIKGFTDITQSDLLLIPDPATLSVLPWRPQQGRVIRLYCHIKNSDGSVFWGDTRQILKTVLTRLYEKGYDSKFSAECEFYLFKTNENEEPTTIPFDNACYLDVAPLDRCENIRREICLCLEEMGIKPENSHHGVGPGQNVIKLRYTDALSGADNLVTFKTAVKTIAARNGLFASFAPKPLPDNNGNGLNIKFTLSQDRENVILLDRNEYLIEAESFIAGVLQKTPEITAFLNPLPNSYERLGLLKTTGLLSGCQLNNNSDTKSEEVIINLPSPDTALNPYIALALILSAGLYGMENRLSLPERINFDFKNTSKDSYGLPENLGDALKLSEQSELVRNTLPKEMLSKFLQIKAMEYQAFCEAEDKKEFFIKNYFREV